MPTATTTFGKEKEVTKYIYNPAHKTEDQGVAEGGSVVQWKEHGLLPTFCFLTQIFAA